MVHNFGLWRQLFDMLDKYILPSKPNIQVKAPLPSPHPSEVQDRFSVLIINLVCPRCWAGLQCREIIYTIYSIYSIYTIYTILLLSTLPTLCTRSTLSTTSVLSRISILSTISTLSIYLQSVVLGWSRGWILLTEQEHSAGSSILITTTCTFQLVDSFTKQKHEIIINIYVDNSYLNLHTSIQS